MVVDVFHLIFYNIIRENQSEFILLNPRRFWSILNIRDLDILEQLKPNFDIGVWRQYLW